MTPSQAVQLAVSGKTQNQSTFQKQINLLSTNCKTIKTLLVEGILKKESRFTTEELDEAQQAWMRG